MNLNKSKVMIFKKGGGRICANERWSYNEEVIEVVQEYRYLGVCFTKNLRMEKHLKEKLVKAKNAIGATWKNCFASKHIVHSSKFRVFEAVSESIMLYASQVWGYKQFELVEKLLRFYVKRIFRLPSNTPNYIVMLETGLSPLFIRTLKLHIDYIIKVLHMSNERLPRKAALEVIHRRSSWYAEWMELAQWCGIQLNLDIENLNDWKGSLYKLIEATDIKYREKYIQEATTSVHRALYSRLCHNLGQRNYFRDENSVEQISMMVRLRGELLRLNYVPHREDLPVLCHLCNQKEREDVLHFLGRCPVLMESRRFFFGCNALTEEEMLSHLNEMEVSKLFNYCKVALAYREMIINETF